MKRLSRSCREQKYANLQGLEKASGIKQRWNNDKQQMTYMSECDETCILELFYHRLIKNLINAKNEYKSFVKIPPVLDKELIDIHFYLIRADVLLNSVRDIEDDNKFQTYCSLVGGALTLVNEYLSENFYSVSDRDLLVKDIFSSHNAVKVQSSRSNACNNINIVCESTPRPQFSNIEISELHASPTKSGKKVTSLKKGFDLNAIWIDGVGFNRVLKLR